MTSSVTLDSAIENLKGNLANVPNQMGSLSPNPQTQQKPEPQRKKEMMASFKTISEFFATTQPRYEPQHQQK
jgi:hypothetical protein